MPDMNMTPRPDNHEASMARADLYKLANYSMKLFKMIQDGQELEGWVQAKITKAADYVASVYHFMEYEMKFSEYGSKLENSDVYTESVKKEFKRKLTEAKAKLEKLKEKNIKDLGEGWEDMIKATKDREKEKGTGKFDKKQTSTGTVYTRKSSTFDDGGKDSDTKKAEKKSKKVKEGFFGNSEEDLAKRSPQLQQLIALRKSPKYQTPEAKASLEARIKKQMDRVSLDKGEVMGSDGKPVKVESLKGGQKKLDVDKDGKLEKSDFAKLRASKGVKEAEERKPAKKSEREVELPSGSKVKATKVQGWQSQKADKESDKERKSSYKAEAAKPDFLDMDKDGNKKEPMKKAIADKKVKEGSTGDYSAKKGAAGKDLGKPGKNFAKIAKSAEKGGAKSGAAVAGAVLKKLRAKG